MSHLLSGVPKIPPSKEEEGLMFGDKDALVLHNIREAYYYAKGTWQGKKQDDGIVLSAAYEGLTKAVKNFQLGKIRFLAYAKPYIRGALCKAARSDAEISKAEEVGRDGEDDHDAHYETGESQHVAPYAAPEFNKDQLPPFDGLFTREEWSRVEPVMREVLDDRERMILELNFLGGLNLREIADLQKVSRSDIHHGKQVALKKIRNRLMELHKFSREA